MLIVTVPNTVAEPGLDSNGTVNCVALVTVAVVRDPAHALPLHGTFIGAASAPLGMEVHVSVTPVSVASGGAA